MSFSASTCLRYTSAPPLGTTINIYSDVDSYSSIIVEVPTSDIIDGNCPYTFLVPDGTTNIRLLDPTSGCYSDIPIRNNDLCVTCNLDFNFYSGNTIGRIIVGDVTGSCQSSISDYVVNWYGPSPSTEIAFISGKGSAFTGYQFTHPLTGTSSILAEEGIYTPVIDKIMIDNIRFSQTGGTGYVQADLDCFNGIPVTIEGYTCDNGGETSDLSQYEHRVKFEGAALGASSPPLSATFKLSATTNYFAWKFKGNVVPDKLKLTFIGSDYSEPIILEYWEVGGQLGTDISLGDLPYSAGTTDYLAKVTVLTGLTINPGDKIIMEITPNGVNPQTNWELYFTCLESFNPEYLLKSETPYKILSDSVAPDTNLGCDRTRFYPKLSGLTTNEAMSTDLFKYLLSNANESFYEYRSISQSGQIQPSLSELHWEITGCTSSFIVQYPPVCSVPNSNTITYKKYVSSGEGVLDFMFSNLSDLTHYYNEYQDILSYSGTPTNNNDIDYYRNFVVNLPNSVGSLNCGDGTTPKSFYVHFSSIVTTGGTGPYSMTMTMPLVTDGIGANFQSCDIDCSGATRNLVNLLNSQSTGTTNNYTGTTNTGAKYVNPFKSVYAVSGPNPIAAVTATTVQGYTQMSNHTLFTIPASGLTSPYTLIPNLSGDTYPGISNDFYLVSSGSDILSYFWRSFVYSYTFELTDPLVPSAFSIYANPISSNGEVDLSIGSKILIYTYDGTTGTIIDSNYFI